MHECQARLQLLLRHLLWLRLSHPITIWATTGRATPVTILTQECGLPVLAGKGMHQSTLVHIVLGPSDSCPLLTGQTVCGAELKHYILEIPLLNPYSRRQQLVYTPSVTDPLLISHESCTSRQKHQTP